MRTAAGVLLLVCVLAGCSSGGGAAADSPATQVACVDAPAALLDRIATGALDGTGMKPVTGKAYLSPDYSKVYFVAVRFSATGIDDQTGVWATNDLDSGTTMSVDGIAKNFTNWPDASKTGAKIEVTDPAVAVAVGCLG